MENNKELSAAYIDGELSSEQRVELEALIASDPDMAYELKVQHLIKKLVQRCEISRAPASLYYNVIKILRSPGTESYKKPSFFAELFRRPQYSAAMLLVLTAAIILLVLNPTPQPSQELLAGKQNGSSNMFLQAKNNFSSILEGKLSPQFVSSNPDEIKNYFASHGVKYETIVPEISGYRLAGAVISEDQGEKFAHHVYADESGHFIYLFQVADSYINENKIVSLSEDLHSYLNGGNCFEVNEAGIGTLMTKVENNIFAVVANVPADLLESQFCNL